MSKLEWKPLLRILVTAAFLINQIYIATVILIRLFNNLKIIMINNLLIKCSKVRGKIIYLRITSILFKYNFCKLLLES